MLEVARSGGEIVGPLLAGGGVWSYLKARTKARAPAAIGASQADLTEAITAQTKMLLAENAKDRRELKRQIVRQDKEIKRVGAQVSQCEAKHADCETNVSELRAKVDKLMEDNPPAVYPHQEL
jgi:septal ring factor EnvC (AmiA/AmiB activator)